jgi:hypothetical protein
VSTPSTTPSANRRLGRRVALAGVLAAAVIGGGAGVAYATGGSGAIVETGYATEVERVRGAEAPAAAGPDRDCPGRDGPGRDGTAGPRGGGSASPDSGETSPGAPTTPQSPTIPETTPDGEL